MIDEQAGSWLTPVEASARLKTTTRTLDRWAKQGKLQKRVSSSGVVQFFIEETASDGVSDDEPGTALVAVERSLLLVERFSALASDQQQPLLEMLAKQQQTIAEQAERIGRLEATLETSRRREKSWWRIW